MSESAVEDIAIELVVVVGEGGYTGARRRNTVPVDGVITSGSAILDEAALTGEPIPVNRRKGEFARSGTLNAGETFEMRALPPRPARARMRGLFAWSLLHRQQRRRSSVWLTATPPAESWRGRR